jgi:protease-4
MQAPLSRPFPPPKKTNWFAWITGICVFCIFGLGLLIMLISFSIASAPAVGVVELSGPITDEGARGLLGGGSTGGARKFIEDVDAARTDNSIKAVVIRVNSPGGSAAASQEMFEAVRRLRAVKPTICSMGDVAASGGYYVAAACDKIYANGSSLTGSIGVISQFVNYSELFKKLGLGEATLKTGKFKDAGNPTRDLTPEERQLFQNMIGDVYSQFIGDVLVGRKNPTNGKLTREKLLALADGRVYTGRQAKANLLIDENGGLYDAVAYAAKQANLSGKPIVRNLSSTGGFGGIFGASTNAVLGDMAENIGQSFARGAITQTKSETANGLAPLAR